MSSQRTSPDQSYFTKSMRIQQHCGANSINGLLTEKHCSFHTSWHWCWCRGHQRCCSGSRPGESWCWAARKTQHINAQAYTKRKKKNWKKSFRRRTLTHRQIPWTEQVWRDSRRCSPGWRLLSPLPGSHSWHVSPPDITITSIVVMTWIDLFTFTVLLLGFFFGYTEHISQMLVFE